MGIVVSSVLFDLLIFLGCASIAGGCSLIIFFLLFLLLFNSYGIHHIDRGGNRCIFCVGNFWLTMAQVSGVGMIYYCNSSHLKNKKIGFLIIHFSLLDFSQL